MQIFIDESGDCGMKVRRSAKYYAMTAVLLETQLTVTCCETALQETRQALGLPTDFEFHFARIKDDYRCRFLSQVANCDFLFVACVLEKSRLHGRLWQKKSFFYEKVIEEVVADAADFLKVAQQTKGKPLKARVTVDDNSDPIYFKVLAEQFKKLKTEAGKPLVDKMRPGRSRSSGLLQLADMICGSTVCWHEGDNRYFDLIQKHGQVRRLFEK